MATGVRAGGHGHSGEGSAFQQGRELHEHLLWRSPEEPSSPPEWMMPVRLARLLTVAAAVFVFLAAVTAPSATAGVPDSSARSSGLTGDLDTHDPALVAGGPGQNWYVFSTGEPSVGGGTIQIRSSPNGHDWTFAGTVWDSIPSWLTKEIPGVNNMWAPEVYHYRRHLLPLLRGVEIGHNDSVIALATNTTLDPPMPPTNGWTRARSCAPLPSTTTTRSIRRSSRTAGDGRTWRSARTGAGSACCRSSGRRATWPTNAGEPLRLASRQGAAARHRSALHRAPGGWYYLFTSWDACCRGVDSTYRIVIGRSRLVTGPYVDRDGKSLLDGGGSTFLATSGNQIGPGGESVSDGILAYHYYDRADGGKPHLALQQLSWSADGWPEISDARQ